MTGSDVGSESGGSQIDRVYEDRNIAGMALCVAMHQQGQRAGWYVDPENESWPVVWCELANGGPEVSWHVPPSREYALAEASPLDNKKPPGGYDGYDREEKNSRLSQYVAGTLGYADVDRGLDDTDSEIESAIDSIMEDD